MGQHQRSTRIQIELPYPPSVNHYWRYGGGRLYIDRRVKDWLAEVEARWIELGRPKMVDGYYKVRVHLYPPDRRRRDIDNTLKAIFDALVQMDIIPDDYKVKALEVYEHPEKRGTALVEVAVWIDPESAR